MKILKISCPTVEEMKKSDFGLIANLDRQRAVRWHRYNCPDCKKKMAEAYEREQDSD